MTRKIILVGLWALIAMPQGANADVIAGWDTFTDVGSDTFNATVTNFASGVMVGSFDPDQGGTSHTIGNWNNATHDMGASGDGTWGSLTGIVPAPSSSVAVANEAVGLLNATEGFFDLTITADATRIVLEGFHFDTYSRFGRSPKNLEVSVLSGGGITAGTLLTTTTSSGSGTMDASDGPNDYDIDLSGLADNILLAGESATFRMEWTGANPSTGSNGGNNAMIDNVAFIGTAVPEPTSLVLLGLGSVAMVMRRRRI